MANTFESFADHGIILTKLLENCLADWVPEEETFLTSIQLTKRRDKRIKSLLSETLNY